MNKKIYKGYELVKAIEDGEIKEGTILIFTSTISKDNKKEVEVVISAEGLILYKKDVAEILPTSWLFNSKIDILEDNTEEIGELPINDEDEKLYSPVILDNRIKINELIRAYNKIRKEKE